MISYPVMLTFFVFKILDTFLNRLFGWRHSLPILRQLQVGRDLFCANFWLNVISFQPCFGLLSLLPNLFLRKIFGAYLSFI